MTSSKRIGINDSPRFDYFNVVRGIKFLDERGIMIAQHDLNTPIR